MEIANKLERLFAAAGAATDEASKAGRGKGDLSGAVRRGDGDDVLWRRRVHQPLLRRTECLAAGAGAEHSSAVSAGRREDHRDQYLWCERVRLERYGLTDRVRELNLAGVKLARESVEQIREKQASDAFVAGAVGPLGVRLEPAGKFEVGEAYAAFAQQIRGAGEGGPGVGADLLIIETMVSLAESEQAVKAANAVAPELP
jgi:hypothetical protein